MTQALERVAPAASRLAQVTGFSDQVINLVAQNVAPGCTRLELATYLYTVSRLGFDPLIQPPLVHFIKYQKDSPAEIVVAPKSTLMIARAGPRLLTLASSRDVSWLPPVASRVPLEKPRQWRVMMVDLQDRLAGRPAASWRGNADLPGQERAGGPAVSMQPGMAPPHRGHALGLSVW